jgi:hypothetical protein
VADNQSGVNEPPMPAMIGDFWFQPVVPGRPSGSGSGRDSVGMGPRPVPGKANLVVAIERLDGEARCGAAPAATLEYALVSPCLDFAYFAELREVAQRFPALEITLLTQTLGYFMTVVTPDPAEEAEVLHQWLQEGQQLPGPLAVVRGRPFFRLPSPDGRYLDLHLTGGGDTTYLSREVTLLDGERMVVGSISHLWGAIRASSDSDLDEPTFMELLVATLRQRPRARVPKP